MVRFEMVFFIAIVLFSLVVSASDGLEICNYMQDEFNLSVGYEVPSAIPYKNDVINGFTKDNEIIGHVVLEDGVIKSLSCNLTDDPSYVVYVDSLQTIKDNANYESTVDYLDDKLGDEIIVKGQSMTKSFKASVTRLVVKVVSWFV